MNVETSTWATKKGLAQMLKGGVIMDVVTPDQARIAEEAGAVAVMALERVPADIRATGAAAPPSSPSAIPSAEIPFRVPGRTLRISASAIECIEARDNYVQVHAGEKEFLVRETITGVESRLPDSFVRIHRSTIVNLDHIEACEPVRNGDARLTLRSGRHLRVSRTRREDFDQRFGD